MKMFNLSKHKQDHFTHHTSASKSSRVPSSHNLVPIQFPLFTTQALSSTSNSTDQNQMHFPFPLQGRSREGLFKGQDQRMLKGEACEAGNSVTGKTASTDAGGGGLTLHNAFGGEGEKTFHSRQSTYRQ